MSYDTNDVRVSLPVFEGPLDLLLYLVKKDEVDIYDIEITKITDHYLQYLAQMETMNLEIAGDFLVMAANLLYIKSRTLLPVADQPPEEDVEEDDPRWELIRQLIEYKKFKEAADHLENKEDLQSNIFHRSDLPVLEKESPVGPGRVGMFDLIQAFQKVLERYEARQGFRELLDEEFTVGQKIEYILDTIQVSQSLSFDKLFGNLASRNEIVVTFLALLELVRLKQLKVKQGELFDEIAIERV